MSPNGTEVMNKKHFNYDPIEETKYAVEYLNESVSSFGYSSLIFDLMYMYNRISSDRFF